jgi:hypothetical protein
MELLGYHSNLNPFSVLDESPTTKSRREQGGFIRPLEPVQGDSHQCLLNWYLRRSWDIHVHLEFGDRFPVGKVAVRDLFVFVYGSTGLPPGRLTNPNATFTVFNYSAVFHIPNPNVQGTRIRTRKRARRKRILKKGRR